VWLSDKTADLVKLSFKNEIIFSEKNCENVKKTKKTKFWIFPHFRFFVGVVIYLEHGSDSLHMIQLMSLPSQNPTISCLI